MRAPPPDHPAQPTPTPPWRRRWETWVVVGLLLLLVVSAWRGSFHYGLWADREMLRSAAWRTDPPYAGAEVTGAAGRIPGPLLGLLFALPRLLQDHPGAVFAEQIGLAALSLLLMHRAGLPLGRGGGALLAIAWLGSPTLVPTLTQLWNPAFMPAFIALACVGAHQLAARRDARWLPLVVGAVALGGQTHLAMFGWGLLLVPGLLLARPRHLVLGVSLAALAFLVIELPYLIGDGLQDWSNTRQLLEDRTVTATPARFWVRPLEALRGLLGLDAPTTSVGVRVAAAALGLFAFVGMVNGLAELGRSKTPHHAILGVHALVVLGLLVTVCFSATKLPARYLLPYSASVAVLAVSGLLVTLEGVQARPRAVLGLLMAGALGLRTAQLPRAFAPVDTSWTTQEAQIRQLTDQLGWSLTDIAGRTVRLRYWDPTTFAWDMAALPLGDRLRRADLHFPGSLPPPCAAIVNGPPGQGADDTAVDRALHEVGGSAVLDVRPIAGADFLLVYDRASGRCPTTTVNRYVLLDEEADVRQRARDQACEEVGVSSPEPQTTRYVTRVPDGIGCDLHLGIDLTDRDGRLQLTLQSPELRGASFNLGWLQGRVVSDLHLAVIDAEGDVHRVDFADGPIGWRHDATPLRLSVDRLGVSGRLALRGHVLPERTELGAPHDHSPLTTFDITLAPHTTL